MRHTQVVRDLERRTQDQLSLQQAEVSRLHSKLEQERTESQRERQAAMARLEDQLDKERQESRDAQRQVISSLESQLSQERSSKAHMEKRLSELETRVTKGKSIVCGFCGKSFYWRNKREVCPHCWRLCYRNDPELLG
jgi:rubrerythrin